MNTNNEQTDETVECDRCHDNVLSYETFTNAHDEVLCTECSDGLVGHVVP